LHPSLNIKTVQGKRRIFETALTLTPLNGLRGQGLLSVWNLKVYQVPEKKSHGDDNAFISQNGLKNEKKITSKIKSSLINELG